MQGQAPLGPGNPAIHVPYTQRGGSLQWGGRSRLHREFQSHKEEEREEEEATAAAGVRKGGGRTPLLPLLSHPAGQVGEDSEECRAQSQGPGGWRGSLLKKWRGGGSLARSPEPCPWRRL